MKRTILFLQILLLFAFTGCQDDSEKNRGVPVSMKFYLFSRQNQLKDITLGVIADFPVNADNLKYTIKADGSMEATDQLRWGKNQSESSAFFIYSPYNSGNTGKTTIPVNVNSDQSSFEKLKGSDFIYAFTKMKPDNRGSDITLSHHLNVLQIPLAVKGNDEVTQVTVEDIVTLERFDAKTGAVTLGSTQQKITAYKDPETNSFCCIFPAQELKFKATVTMKSGHTVTLQADAPLAKWTGKIYRLDDIQVSDKDQIIRIQSSRTTITDWSILDIPENPGAAPILSMAELLATDKPDGQDIDFRLEGITATAIAESQELGMAIFEDKSAAAPVYLGGNLPGLKVGTTLSGLVTLRLDTKDGKRVINIVRTNRADITEGSQVPLTEGTFAGLPAMKQADTYRRTVFHNVSIESAFKDGSAIFIQDGTRVRVLCEGQDGLAIKANVSDLTGFPVVDGDSMAIYIPDHKELTSFIVTREESGFTDIRYPGMYDISDMANPKALFAYDGKNQLSTKKSDIGYETQIADLRLNKSLFIQLPGFSFANGETYQFFVEAYGHYDFSKGDGMAECFFVDEDLVWLIDKADRNIGYIMAFEK